MALIGFLAVAAFLVAITRDLPNVSDIEFAQPRMGGEVYLDRDGRVIARRGASRGASLSVDELPPYLIDAVLSVEDRRFYDHSGIDLRGIARAMWANIRAGSVVQGGSTITQQLAKNLFLTSDRTFVRKIQEMVLAWQLEQRFTKDEILALYLDRVYFGAGAYGVEAAAQRYFGRSARDVTLGEAALLAGLLKAPSRYSPANDLERAAARATVVLDLMFETGSITEEERIEAAQTPIRVARAASTPGSGYFIDWIEEEARELAGDREADIVVFTTLDIDAQRAAENAVRTVMTNPETARGADQAALVAMSGDGSIRALVGGVDYATSPYNRAILARRQPGSAFKAFVYAAAFEGGLRPEDVRDDMPVAWGDWSPQNYNGQYSGPMTLETAFARSSNVVAARVAEETGHGFIAQLARRLGIESEIRVDRSMALGSFEVTPIELATAYTAFANGGYRAYSHAIDRIETVDGEVLYERDIPDDERVLDQRTLSWMRRLLETTARSGTARFAATPGATTGAKTGTTNDNRDAWIAGYTGGLTAAVWVGNDDFTPTDRAAGSGPPAAIFRAFMGAAPAEASVPANWQERVEEAEEEDRRDPISSLLDRIGLGGQP
ncbi:PBP1A family penicillin-binding protein [Hyphobacterium sp. HN65]|uniref:peptidoglycan glycosyltransferase n=1 Tax=Hyphobacterium lacteum TaxID=3116575 RepID=A0ABU7LTQ0_9PROT|nr:PBP1A family penicillin-binding protein [Hyphobacterium sp. HN65]MEE2527288.1 PBP1A family penicillin-binding protein [Hyphobacterium sp. HN65]